MTMPPRSAPPRVNDRPVNEAAERPRTEAGQVLLKGIEVIAGATALIANEVLDVDATCELICNIEREASGHERQQGREEAVAELREQLPHMVEVRYGLATDKVLLAYREDVMSLLDRLAATSTEEPSDD